jgi:hypothetical protein
MSLLTQASLVLTPNAVKASKLYSIIPSNGNGDMTVVRATTATRVNSAGLIESVASNVPRLNYDSVGGCPSILIEPQRTNRLLNSDVVVTQSITTAGLQMAVSFYGTGTITFSGTFVGSLVGTGVDNRVSTVFTPTTGTLVLTVTGSVTKGQVETGGYATSYIPTVASVTRNADAISKTGISDLIGQTEGTVFIDFQNKVNEITTGVVVRMLYSITDGTNNNRISHSIIKTATRNYTDITIRSNNVTVSNINVDTPTGRFKIAVSYKIGATKMFINGVLVGNVGLSEIPIINRLFLGCSTSTGGENANVGINTFLISKTALTDSECIALTTL